MKTARWGKFESKSWDTRFHNFFLLSLPPLDVLLKETLCQLIYDDMIEEIVLGLYFQVHRSLKLGFLFLDESTYEE